VCIIGTDRVTDKSLEKKMGEVLSAEEKEMSEIKSNIAALSTQMASPPSFTSLRLCILAIRGWLKPRELPLWSLKPPYFPEMTLVSPLSETPTRHRGKK
jgi:hypothetical protein